MKFTRESLHRQTRDQLAGLFNQLNKELRQQPISKLRQSALQSQLSMVIAECSRRGPCP